MKINFNQLNNAINIILNECGDICLLRDCDSIEKLQHFLKEYNDMNVHVKEVNI